MFSGKDLKLLWELGDKEFIDYAFNSARLTLFEKDVVKFILFDGLTQEKTAEKMDISVRNIQYAWKNIIDKILRVPGVIPYTNTLK